MNTPLIRRLLLASAVLGLAVSAFSFLPHLRSRVSNGSIQPPRPEAEPDAEQERERLFKERAYPTGWIPAGTAEQAWRESMGAFASQSAKSEEIQTADLWTNIGPAPEAPGQIEGSTANPRVSGRVMDVAVDPSQPVTHWYIAADTGGIWETTDAGGSWTPKSDYEISLLMSTITVAPSNPQILFASTRDSSGALLKSTNGGTSWNLQHSFPNQGYFWFSGVEVHPTNPSIVEVIIWYGLDQANSGVYKSTDGGTTFSLKLAGPGTSLGIHPVNFNQQYAAIRNSFWAPLNNGVFRSYDGGDTWALMSGPWGTIAPGGGVTVAVAPTNGNIVYVVVPGSGIWRSLNAWKATPTWTPITPPGSNFTDASITTVDPVDPLIFYMGGQGHGAFYRLNADGTWTYLLPSTHLDQHAFGWTVDAQGTKVLMLGNDGGFWTSTDRGSTWVNKNSNLATVQFVTGSLHPTDGTRALGGSQDNGTALWTGPVRWAYQDGGDGSYDAFSRTDPDHYWMIKNNVYFWKVYVDNLGGLTLCDGSAPETTTETRRSPDNNDLLAGGIVWNGSQYDFKLWKSTDFFNPPCSTHPVWTVNGPTMSSEIGAIAFAPSDGSSQTYAFGAGGELRYTSDGGATWKDLDPNGVVPNRSVTSIAFHPDDPDTLYVALSGYNAQTPGAGHVFKTTNATKEEPTWSDVSPGPSPGQPVDVPMNSLAIDPTTPTTLYAGGDLGVWKSTNGGASGSWTHMAGNGMPNVIVSDLHFSPADGRLVAFTYGRSAFKLNVVSLQVTIAPPAAITAGARWKVDNGAFQESGTIVKGLAPRSHTVSFSPVSGYNTPANQTVTITANQTTQATGSYTLLW
jgi:photosystem II stability/assembly factor-like uncharacterized protein